MVRDVTSWVRKGDVSRLMPTFLAEAAGWMEVPFAEREKMKTSVLFLLI